MFDLLLDSLLTKALGKCRLELPIPKHVGSTTTAAMTANPTQTNVFSSMDFVIPKSILGAFEPEPISAKGIWKQWVSKCVWFFWYQRCERRLGPQKCSLIVVH